MTDIIKLARGAGIIIEHPKDVDAVSYSELERFAELVAAPLKAENDAQKTRVRELCDLIRKVHKAKGRYHTQIAMCDLFDGLGLPNERPDAARAKEQT